MGCSLTLVKSSLFLKKTLLLRDKVSCHVGHPSLAFTFLVVSREMVVSFMVKDSVGAGSRFDYGSAELLICRDRLRGSVVMLLYYFERPLSSERILALF